MLRAHCVLAALAAAAVTFAPSAFAGAQSPANGFIVAADDAPPAAGDDTKADDTKANDTTGSAKMGKEEGTHTGDAQGAKPESDTVKVEQPPRRNTPSNDDSKP